MKKRIGISFTTTNFQYYWNWFTEKDLGDDLELVLLSFETPDLQVVHSCAGFVLTGGIDINPDFYNGTPEYPNQPSAYQSERDRFEAVIYKHAKENKAPLLAICRGMQLVHTIEGGKLIQDLGEQNNLHKIDAEQDKQHTVQLMPGSHLSEWAGADSGAVNSAHHQALDPSTVSPCWRISAVDDTGLIEGIEWKEEKNHPFLIGVQWHPERMLNKEQNPLSQAIKEHLLQSIRKQI